MATVATFEVRDVKIGHFLNNQFPLATLRIENHVETAGYRSMDWLLILANLDYEALLKLAGECLKIAEILAGKGKERLIRKAPGNNLHPF